MPQSYAASLERRKGANSGARDLRLAVLVSAAVFAASAAAADDMEAPRIVLSSVNWAAAAASLPQHGNDTPQAEFARDQIHGYGADPRMATSKGSMKAVIQPAQPSRG